MAGYTIDIDTGGTFTDCFLHRDGEVRTVKVPTTPHDLTICFLESIKAGAAAFGSGPEDLLYETDIVRFSSTIGTNTLIQRDGSKIGLLVTAGMEHLAPTHEDGRRSPLVAADMVIGIAEQTPDDGEAHGAPDPGAVLTAAQTLIDRGARCLVVAFRNSDRNPANERLVRDTIKREYPRDYLGSVPVFLASDISPRPGAVERINSVVLNGYMHAKLARLLYKAGEDLRRLHYQNNLFIGHNNGSVARVARTRAINTYNSGPAAGLLGAWRIADLYGAQNIITTDMGGTSFDIGYVSQGLPVYALEPEVEGFRCNLPMIRIRAFGAGGGSIARVVDDRLCVGPQSAGAVPGPACFNLGGNEPTLTDANLVLGILDPDYFLGGAMRLDRDKACATVNERIAGPLGLSLEEAAFAIRTLVEQSMGAKVAEVKKGMPAEADPVLIAYGGAGAVHACSIAGIAGVRRIVITPFSAVASAFSSSLMDVGHQYYRRLDVALNDAPARERLLDAVASMQHEAERDMRGEGFSNEQVRTEVQLIARRRGGGPEAMVRLTPACLENPGWSAEVVLKAAAGLGIDAVSGDAELVATTVGLLASAAVPHFQFAGKPRSDQDLEQARKGTRAVWLDPDRAYVEMTVFARERLGHGHEFSGPAIIESDQTTLLVPDGWQLSIDQYNNALLKAV